MYLHLSLLLILICVGAFLCVSFSFSFFRLVALWHLNKNTLRPKTLFILGHLLLHFLTPLLLTYDSVMIKPERTFQRTFHDEAFIRNAKSFYQIFLILTFLLSSIVEVGSHCVASWSLVPPWSYKSFTQHGRIRYFSTSVYHSRLRYVHCSYSGSYIWGTTHTKGSAS